MNEQFLCEAVKSDTLHLLNRFYKSNGHRGKATAEDLAFWLRTQDSAGNVLAAVRFMQDKHGLLLRGLWVSKDKRQQGLGSELMQQTAPIWKKQPTYCFPYSHLEGFYAEQGFTIAAEDHPAQDKLRHYLQRGADVCLMCYQPPCD